MKDSGIEWIGEIPADWNVSKIKYFVDCYDGKRIPIDSAKRESGPYPYWGAGNVTDYVKDYIFDEELVLLGEDGAPFFDKNRPVAFLVNEKIWVNNHIHVLKVHTDTNPSFLTYFLNAVDYKSYINGSILNKLTQSNMNSISYSYPSKTIQQKIADFLDKKCSQIDTALEKTRNTIEEYKKYKQAIITKAVTKGIRGDRPMKDSGIEWIGEIPAEWKIINGHRIVLGTQNGLTRRDLEKSTGSIVLKLKNISPEGNIDYSESNRISLTDKEEDTYKLTEGDFIFVRVNGSKSLVGKCAIFKDIGEMVAYNDHIIRVKYNNLLDKKFIQWYMLSSAGKSEINKYTSTAAGQFTISGEGIRNITFVYPPTNEQQEIADYLDEKCAAIDAIIAKKEQLITDLESYKKSLIYEYVTGKKEVK